MADLGLKNGREHGLMVGVGKKKKESLILAWVGIIAVEDSVEGRFR